MPYHIARKKIKQINKELLTDSISLAEALEQIHLYTEDAKASPFAYLWRLPDGGFVGIEDDKDKDAQSVLPVSKSEDE